MYLGNRRVDANLLRHWQLLARRDSSALAGCRTAGRTTLLPRRAGLPAAKLPSMPARPAAPQASGVLGRLHAAGLHAAGQAVHQVGQRCCAWLPCPAPSFLFYNGAARTSCIHANGAATLATLSLPEPCTHLHPAVQA